MKKKPIQVFLDEDLKNWLFEKAKKRGLSLSSYVREILIYHLEQNKEVCFK